jgi:hypothetical protein
MTKQQKLSGVIKEVVYRGKPPLIKLEVDKKLWTVIMAPPPRMEFRGIANDMIKVGMPASVVAYPSKQIRDELRAVEITIGKNTVDLR